MSHARAVAAYDQDYRATQGGQIGISLNGDFYEPWDKSDPQDHEAAERRMQFHIGWFANPILYVTNPPETRRYTNFMQLEDGLPRLHAKAAR